jgi:short-subunit dehydrogenase
LSTPATTPATVLITGASRGIGAATARAFAEAGFNLVLIARSADALEQLAVTLRRGGSSVETCCLDLSDPKAIAPGLEALLERGVQPDVLINNAGAAYTGSLAEMPLDRWQWLLQLNLTSVFQVCQTLLPALRRQRGMIINVSSHAARNAFPDWGAYCTSKAALASFSRCLAEEERQHGVRVSTLTLGAVNTPLWDSETVHSSFDRHAMLSPERVAEALVSLAQQPPSQIVEDATLMPAAGVL